jgi:cytochrome b6-f complex iron-sulfur subunit
LDRHDDLISLPQTRRDFCVQACRAVSLITVGTALQGCGGSPTSPSGESAPPLSIINGSVASGAVTVAVDAGSPLASTGSAALVRSSAGSFVVARTAQDAFTALTAICTHEGCEVSGFASPEFVCPCHGSRYTTSGAVVAGPATRALRQFTTRFANNVLTITL